MKRQRAANRASPLRRWFFSAAILLFSAGAVAAASWGDQGDGTYKNPILNADYSDPDVIRVGSDFYLVCSEFHFMGIPVLHSKDLVNWTIIGQVYRRFDNASGYSTFQKYGQGSWAPSIRFHDN